MIPIAEGVGVYPNLAHAMVQAPVTIVRRAGHLFRGQMHSLNRLLNIVIPPLKTTPPAAAESTSATTDAHAPVLLRH